MEDLFDLVEYRPSGSGWTLFQTHLYSKPYALCKHRKDILSKNTNTKSFFKIVKPNEK